MAESLRLSSSTWQSCSPADIVWADLGNDLVIFHRPSGKTHFLNASSAFLLDEVLKDPASTDDIVSAFTTESADENDKAAVIVEMLLHLERLGLVRRHDGIGASP